jgi:hypothetical protein
MSANVKRFVLSFVNAAEDIPRLIRAYGKCCEGECAFVLRPQENRGLLVHHDKKGGATFWSEKVSDAPEKPTEAIDLKESVAMVKVYQKALPKAGPITLRGNWRGYLYCEDGSPRVELERKLATYGTLIIESVAGKGWKYRVVRAEKWYSKPGDQDGIAYSLTTAIEKGLAAAMGLLGEACSVRDSHRRAAFDSQYAETHPIKPAREGKDPTERFNPKEPKPPKAPKEPKAKGQKGTGKGTGTAATAPTSSVAPTTAPLAGTASHASGGQGRKRVQRADASTIAAVVPTLSPAAAPEIDPEKDKLLLDAFSKAVAAALGGGAAA